MSSRTVITIARQYGSGGREIGEMLAQKLGVPYYDKELIALAAKKSGLSEEVFRQADELCVAGKKRLPESVYPCRQG